MKFWQELLIWAIIFACGWLAHGIYVKRGRMQVSPAGRVLQL